jgi:hypothetical protein
MDFLYRMNSPASAGSGLTEFFWACVLWLMNFFEPHCNTSFTLGGESGIQQRLSGTRSKGTEITELGLHSKSQTFKKEMHTMSAMTLFINGL